MNRYVSTTAIAACFTTALLAVASFAPAEAKTNFMTECSAKFKAAKASGSIDASVKWTDFMKTSCAAQGQANQTPAAATAPVARAKAAPVTTAKVATPPRNANFMQQCSSKWQAMKQAGTIPAGLKWTSFVRQNCDVSAASGATQNTGDNAVPAEPTNANFNSYQSIDVATTDKNGKPFTAGQIAAHKRIKECAIEWHNAKQNGGIPAGEKWPQYWSDCNTRLKSQG